MSRAEFIGTQKILMKCGCNLQKQLHQRSKLLLKIIGIPITYNNSYLFILIFPYYKNIVKLYNITSLQKLAKLQKLHDCTEIYSIQNYT